MYDHDLSFAVDGQVRDRESLRNAHKTQFHNWRKVPLVFDRFGAPSPGNGDDGGRTDSRFSTSDTLRETRGDDL